MITTGCESNSIIKDPKVDRIEVIKEKIKHIKYDIPIEMLTECQWFKPLEGNTKADNAKVDLENARRFEECFYMNNAKVKLLRTLGQDDGIK